MAGTINEIKILTAAGPRLHWRMILDQTREFMHDPSELDLWYDSTQSWRMLEDLKANAEALHGK